MTDTVPSTDVLQAIRQGQSAEAAIIERCRTEVQAISVDDTLTSTEKQTRIRQLQRMRNQANQALSHLEDDERDIVAESQYARAAVDALNAAAQALNNEVNNTNRIAARATSVSGIIDGVADAANAVVSRAT